MEPRSNDKQQELLSRLSQQQAEDEAFRATQTNKLESYQPSSDLKVRITALPGGGSEFYFPAAPFETNAAGQSLLLLVMASILTGVRGPLFDNPSATNHSGDWLVVALYVGFVVLAVLLLLRVLRLWFAPERVTIVNGTVSATTGIFHRTRIMPVAEIVSIHAVQGSTQRHCAIFIRGSGLRHVTVGDGIRQWRDADWVAMQMSRAAGIKPSASLRGDELAGQLQVVQSFLEKSGNLQQQQSRIGIDAELQAFPESRDDESGKLA